MGITNPVSMDHPEIVAIDEARNGSGPVDLKNQVSFQLGQYVGIGDEIFLIDDLQEMVKSNPPEKSPKMHPMVEQAFNDLMNLKIKKGGNLWG